MNALPVNVRYPWDASIERLLKEVMPLGWSWPKDPEVIKRLLKAHNASPYNDAIALFTDALFKVAIERHGQVTKAARAIGIDVETIRQAKIRIRDRVSKASETARQTAMELAVAFLPEGGNYYDALSLFDRQFADAAVSAAGERTKAARALGIHPNTMFRLINRQRKPWQRTKQ